ncbi:MAG: methyltransferase domain-containing protein [Actinobacteria bacterium]|nr:methyltransferase domain-containing protein [Actinomycetota bacterium]
MTGRELRARMYGPQDLSSLPLFAGGFINFGYWRGIPLDGELSVEQRISSQQQLYRLVLRTLDLSSPDRILEVGCGLGLGSALAAEEFGASEVRGIDLVPDQVQRAERVNAPAMARRPGLLGFRAGSASAIPHPDGSFDAAMSVEAAQHFDDLPGFATEASRVLVPGGRLVVTSFFATTADSATRLPDLLETFASGIDLATPIDALATALQLAGFIDVEVRSIGEDVWPGWDRWIARTDYRDSWSRNWLVAARQGLLDYFVISARNREVRISATRG